MNKEALQLLLKRLKNYHGDPSSDDLWDIIQEFNIELQAVTSDDETSEDPGTDIDGGNGGNHPPGPPGKP